jgi:hypothetical protein
MFNIKKKWVATDLNKAIKPYKAYGETCGVKLHTHSYSS